MVQLQIFYIAANMFFNVIHENKILTKISEFKVFPIFIIENGDEILILGHQIKCI